jgi:hypothetical protein
MGPRAGLVDMEKWKFLSVPGLELRHLCRPARSLTPLYLLRYSDTYNCIGPISTQAAWLNLYAVGLYFRSWQSTLYAVGLYFRSWQSTCQETPHHSLDPEGSLSLSLGTAIRASHEPNDPLLTLPLCSRPQVIFSQLRLFNDPIEVQQLVRRWSPIRGLLKSCRSVK